MKNLIDLFERQAQFRPDKVAFTFLKDGKTPFKSITYSSLFENAKAIAAHLQEQGLVGSRALLLYSSGLEFIEAFAGCLLARTTAVPVNAPQSRRGHWDRLIRIIEDSSAGTILTTSTKIELATTGLKEAAENYQLSFLETDQILKRQAAASWQRPPSEENLLAFLQYTSGSTGMPKGVRVTHSNILHNLALMTEAFDQDDSEVYVSWLPLFHDLGLIGNVLQTLYLGASCYFMTPAAFLQKPERWLSAISKYKATTASAPNFAYDLCARHIDAAARAELDLSSWRLAQNAAEPIRAATIDRFTAQFADCGFRPQVMYPGYGLAEATLVVTAAQPGKGPVVRTFSGPELEKGHAVAQADRDDPKNRQLVSSGRVWGGQQVMIVDPETCVTQADARVGEIWVQGQSIADGYWQRETETARVFAAYTSDDQGPFMRTGDLGFFLEGELYVTGRLKELIIINGENHYPQDIEYSVQQSHQALQSDAGAAFTLEVEGEERLVVVQEVKRTELRKVNSQEAFSAIKRAVSRRHDLPIHEIVLIRTASLSKTSSGKIQRNLTRRQYENGTLAIVARSGMVAKPIAETQEKPKHNYGELEYRLIDMLAARSGLQTSDIDPHQAFVDFGMGSREMVGFSGEIAEYLGRELPPTLLYDYTSIADVARYLTGDPVRVETAVPGYEEEPIALVGAGCRFPGGVNNLDDFWELLAEGTDAVVEVPPDRWDSKGLFDRDARPGKMISKWGGFLDGVDGFDAAFFGIAPREANSMDPQQRLLLQTVWEALEHSGIAPDKTRGSRSGVFIGISTNDYARLQAGLLSAVGTYSGTGNAFSIAANRLSYFLDWRGPSLAIDTACSSSLVALHLACQSLKRGECQLAVAGGVNLILVPDLNITFSQAGMLSPAGRCKTFSDDADGYVRGEGCGVVVLKHLSQAQADGDRILAIIRGTAVNQDGASNGLTAPNGRAQEAVIREALSQAHLNPAQIGYVEAHGTGTALGDPIEVGALDRVYGQNRPAGSRLRIGSVKTNFGHLEAAAGMAGLLKTLLILRRGVIPPHLHLSSPSTKIAWNETAIDVPTQLVPWGPTDEPRRAGVSSFGFGGTNAHTILEEPPRLKRSGERPNPDGYILTLSAIGDSELQQKAAIYADYLEKHPEIEIGDFCYSANIGRTAFKHRAAIVGNSVEDFRRSLNLAAGGEWSANHHDRIAPGKRARIAFLFTGQGAQYPGMGKRLYHSEPVFKQEIDRCFAFLAPKLGTNLTERFFDEEQAGELLDFTQTLQPLLFAFEYALAKMLMSWDVKPEFVMGHSVGEYAAASVAGVFTPEEALELLVGRGKLMGDLPTRGAMAAIFSDRETVEAALAPYKTHLAMAAINAPDRMVISGDFEALNRLLDEFSERGISYRKLQVSQAFHSPLMDSLLPDFKKLVSRIKLQPPQIELISNVTGEPIGPEICKTEYWVKHLRGVVRFQHGVEGLLRQGVNHFVEIGPKPTLLSLAQQCAGEHKAWWLPSLRQGFPEQEQLLRTLATLYTHGVDIDWASAYRPSHYLRVNVPTYPFQHQRFWFSTTKRLSNRNSESLDHPFLERAVASAAAAPGSRLYEVMLEAASPSYLKHHRIFDRILFPATGFFEIAAAAGRRAFAGAVDLAGVTLFQPLILPEDDVVTVQILLAPPVDGKRTFKIMSCDPQTGLDAPEWFLHASGSVLASGSRATPHMEPLDEIIATLQEEDSSEGFYAEYQERGMAYGRDFQGVNAVWRGDGEALGRIRILEYLHSELNEYILHPVLLDACLQVTSAAVPVSNDRLSYLPMGVENLRIYHPPSSVCYSHVRVRAPEGKGHEVLVVDIELRTSGDQLVALVEGLTLRKTDPVKLFAKSDNLYEPIWVPTPLPIEASTAASHWLIVGRNTQLATSLITELEQNGQTTNSALTEAENGAAIFLADSLENARSMVKTLANQSPLQGLVYLAEAGVGSNPDAAVTACVETLNLIRVAEETALPIWIITNGAQWAVDHDNLPNPALSSLWGLARVATLEYPDLVCRRVDLDPLQPDVAALARELMASTKEDQVALRATGRHKLLVRRIASQQIGMLRLQSNASYLIAGGLGGLGLAAAQRLAKRGAGRLILIARRAPSPAALEAIAVLEHGGTKVEVAQVDITDSNAVDHLFQEIATSGQPLRGILQMAGAWDDAPLAKLGRERFESVLAPKLQGTLNLHEASQSCNLDFFLLFSSAASLLGSAGQGNYAAANAFLDGFAFHRRARGQTALSINWGVWSEIGVAARLDVESRLAQLGMSPLPPEIGLNIMEALASRNAAQVAVMRVDWALYAGNFTDLPPFLSQLTGEASAVPPPAAVHFDMMAFNAASTNDQHFIVIDFLRTQLAKVLGTGSDRIEPEKALNTTGMDSLMAVGLRNQIKNGTGVDIPIIDFLEGSTLTDLARHVLAELQSESEPQKTSAETNDWLEVEI